MSQLNSSVPSGGPALSPLFISDRLISLAEQADRLGCQATARHLIRLASSVLEEAVPPPPRYCAG